MTPLLVLGFGVPAVTAVGTDLLYAGFTKAAARSRTDSRATSIGASPARSPPEACPERSLALWALRSCRRFAVDRASSSPRRSASCSC
jgi:hypothetical protein